MCDRDAKAGLDAVLRARFERKQRGIRAGVDDRIDVVRETRWDELLSIGSPARELEMPR